MTGRAACLLACVALVSSCGEHDRERIVEETRLLTTHDAKLVKLGATSDERFRDAKPAPVRGKTPDGWLQLPASQFRLLNYRFGESGMGEVWVTIASGGVADNVNRWLGQFGGPPLDASGVDAMERAAVAGTTGVWVEAAGEYASGMGAPPKPGFALAGVIATIDAGILTVKMVGPEAEVTAAKAALREFAAGLELVR